VAAIDLSYEGRFAEMKLLFTRLQEEITTVKKSVTQFSVETGSPRFKTDESPVIDITPEPSRVNPGDTHRPLKASANDQKAPLALNTKAQHVSDVVDLQGMSKRDGLCHVTYSASRTLTANPSPRTLGDDRSLKLDDMYNLKNGLVYQKSNDSEDLSLLDEKRIRYQLTTRKFISTQEMIEYHSAQEKRVSFELTI
jgi:hypothetical protein